MDDMDQLSRSIDALEASIASDLKSIEDSADELRRDPDLSEADISELLVVNKECLMWDKKRLTLLTEEKNRLLREQSALASQFQGKLLLVSSH
jgi:hypothetical protein